MKLGTLLSPHSKDGELVIVSQDNQFYTSAHDISPNLLSALENWSRVEPELQKRSVALNSGQSLLQKPTDGFKNFASALPRTWLFADGSAFIHHIKLVRKARNAALPETIYTVPLMYQAESGRFLNPTENIPQIDFSHGTDFEAEVGVIVDHVPMGIQPEAALKHIKLIVLINDVSLRGLIPEELAQGFGFFQSKPNKALSPMAITLDELENAWKDGRIHLPLNVTLNNQFFGRANAKEMHFHFGQLIAHAAKTRDLAAGTLIGSGTVANEDATVGSSCLAEKRTLEQINEGKVTTPFMKVGDRIQIEMFNQRGESLFGQINQVVSQAELPR